MKERLLKKISDRSIVVGVVGLGYVGLPLAVEKAKAGYKTIGFDINKERVNMVNNGINYIGDVIEEDLTALVKRGQLSATSDYSFISEADFIAICVPTPLDRYKQPNIDYVTESAKRISEYLTAETMVVLESTTYPGTTRELLLPILENGSGLICGNDFYLGFSPERVDPGNEVFKTFNTPKVVGAIGKDATETIAAMYRNVIDSDIYEVSSPEIAEMEKILENTYRNINIGLVNELAQLCDRMGIDIWEVIDAAKTKPYGFQAFYPGAGVGGHCIPLDPYYLSWKAREYDFHTSMIENSMMINERMPEYCVERISRLLNEKNKSIKGANILIVGITYKADIDDYRESPAIDIYHLLEKRGASITFFDPHAKDFTYKGHHYKSEPDLTDEMLRSSDIVVITAAHKAVDYTSILKNASCIFDTKNIMRTSKNFGDNVFVL